MKSISKPRLLGEMLILVPGGGYALHLQKPRLRLFTEVTKWLSLDQPGWRMEITAKTRP